MIANSWIIDSLGSGKLQYAAEEAGRRRLQSALELRVSSAVSDQHLRFVSNALELQVFDLLDTDNQEVLRSAAIDAFQIARALSPPAGEIAAGEWLVRLACLGVLADRGADVRRLLSERDLPRLPLQDEDWGTRVWGTILDIWLRLFRKQGWDDSTSFISAWFHCARIRGRASRPFWHERRNLTMPGRLGNSSPNTILQRRPIFWRFI